MASDNEPTALMKAVAMDPTMSNIGVIHPTSQQLWNSGNSTNPFFAGAAAQAGGPLQQQRNVNKGGKSSNSDTVRSAGPTGNSSSSSRQVERPDKKEGRSYAYRKR